MRVKDTRTTIIAIEGSDSFSPFLPYGLLLRGNRRHMFNSKPIDCKDAG
jgi:hypothetical protein